MLPKDYRKLAMKFLYLSLIASTWSRPMSRVIQHLSHALYPEGLYIIKHLPIPNSKGGKTKGDFHWLAPCAGSHLPIRIYPASDNVPTPLIESNIEADVSEIKKMMKINMRVLQRFRSLYMKKVFGYNKEHIRHLNRKSYFPTLRHYRVLSFRDTSLRQLQRIYILLQEMAAFFHFMKMTHFETRYLHTPTDDSITEFLNLVEHGDFAGIYRVLCKLKNILTEYDAVPPTPKLGLKAKQKYFKASRNKADRQNREYALITSLLHALRRTVGFLNQPS